MSNVKTVIVPEIHVRDVVAEEFDRAMVSGVVRVRDWREDAESERWLLDGAAGHGLVLGDRTATGGDRSCSCVIADVGSVKHGWRTVQVRVLDGARLRVPEPQYEAATCVTVGSLRAVGVTVDARLPDNAWMQRGGVRLLVTGVREDEGGARAWVTTTVADPFRWHGGDDAL